MNIVNQQIVMAGLGLFAALSGANATSLEAVPQAYREQAQRCISLVRAAVADSQTTALHHTIADVRKIGARREFTIETTVRRSTGEEPREFSSRCLAERWGSEAELQWVRPSPPPRRSTGT